MSRKSVCFQGGFQQCVATPVQGGTERKRGAADQSHGVGRKGIALKGHPKNGIQKDHMIRMDTRGDFEKIHFRNYREHGKGGEAANYDWAEMLYSMRRDGEGGRNRRIPKEC